MSAKFSDFLSIFWGQIWVRSGSQIIKNGAITIFCFFCHILSPIAQNLKCATLFVSHTHAFTFTHARTQLWWLYILRMSNHFCCCEEMESYHLSQADISTLNASCSLFKLCVCVCVSRQRVCVGEYVCFLEGVNRNLFRHFSISAGVAQRKRKIRLPVARYYLLPPPIYHSFSGRGGSAACFRLTTVHLRAPQSSVFLPQLKAPPVSHCFSHSDVASEVKSTQHCLSSLIFPLVQETIPTPSTEATYPNSTCHIRLSDHRTASLEMSTLFYFFISTSNCC